MRAPTGVNKPLSRSNAQHPDTEPVGGATGLDGGHDTASQCDNTAKPPCKTTNASPAKQAESLCRMARPASRNGPFCHAKRPEWQGRMAPAGIFPALRRPAIPILQDGATLYFCKQYLHHVSTPDAWRRGPAARQDGRAARNALKKLWPRNLIVPRHVSRNQFFYVHLQPYKHSNRYGF